MNRELKFRVWLHDTKEWGNVSCIEVFNSTGKLEYLYQDQPYTIQQYTGLKDKNGKEIYEGDIIQYHRCDSAYYLILKSVVYFYNGQFGFDLKGFNDMFFALGDEVCPEIVGNIFENPDYFKNK